MVPFSIHYWIVFLETWHGPIPASQRFVFQYPLLDRISWNPCDKLIIPLPPNTFSIHYWIVFLETLQFLVNKAHIFNFQYPLLDRISWNSFRRLTTWRLYTFQYPLLDRISWNTRKAHSSYLFGFLSVSTIGSYFLKLCMNSASVFSV